MAVSKGVWGIDIGQCALKAIRLEAEAGKPVATAFDYIEHTKILSQPDADPDALIREALEKFLSRNPIGTDAVAIGIAGQSGLARFVKLPPVEENKIAEIVKFEAKQQIPFPLDEVVWDFQKISGGEAVDGFALETEIGLFAMKRDVISRYLGYFTGSKIEVHTVQMTPLALVNFATYEVLHKGGPDEPAAEAADDDTPRGKKRCAVVMDIGTDASNLIITDGGKIIWQRPIPLGGNNFTRAMTKELKLTFAKAEHLKRNAARSPEMASILKAIKPVLTDFVGEVQRSLGYFTNTHRDAHVAYMVGLGSAFKLPGLQKYLSDKLSLEVRKPARFNRLGGDAVLADPLFQENLLTFPVAYGLALQGLGLARLSTNLLPHEIRLERIIRAKKPYAVAAAAMLLVGTCGLAWGFSQDYKSVADDRIEKARSVAKSAIDKVNNQESRVNAKKEESKKTQDEVKTIIAGQEERLNWPRFFEVLTAAMPRPGEKADGGNIDKKDFNWLGEGNAGLEALHWFKQRMASGVPFERALEDERSEKPKFLAMVNVEAVHSRWVNDIPGFLAAADAAVYGDPEKKIGYGRSIAADMKEGEFEKDESQGGRPRPKWNGEAGQGAWVVEIRGYTDHKDGPQFIRNALVRNLQKMNTTFAAGGDKVGKFIVGVPDPVKDRISHVFIYNFWKVDDAPPNSFFYINSSYLDRLLGDGGAAAGGGPGLGAAPDLGAAPGVGSAAPGISSPAGMGSADGDGSASTAGPVGPPWRGITPTSSGIGANTGGGDRRDLGADRRRWEFVVMLLWREPIPSGSGTPEETSSGATAGPGAAFGAAGSAAGPPPGLAGRGGR